MLIIIYRVCLRVMLAVIIPICRRGVTFARGDGIGGWQPGWCCQLLPNLRQLLLSYNNIQAVDDNLFSYGLRLVDLSHNDIAGHLPSLAEPTSRWETILFNGRFITAAYNVVFDVTVGLID
jgi:hypothetical protein